MNAQELMSKHVHAVHFDDPVNEAARLMWDHDCGCVPVVDHGYHVIGMLTDRDICMGAYTSGTPLANVRVGSVMAPDPVTCRPTDSLEAIAGVMRRGRVRRVPIIDDAGLLKGLVSLNDLSLAVSNVADGPARQRLADEVARTLSAISEHRPGRDELEARVDVMSPAPPAAAPASRGRVTAGKK